MINKKDKVRKTVLFRVAFCGTALFAFLWTATAQMQDSAKTKEAPKTQSPARGQRTAHTQEPSHSLELTRPIRPWEFLSAVGTQAGLLGDESGRMEAWVYPLKILRDFHLKIHVDGRVLPAESLARTLITRPESSTIAYAGDTFSVRETFFVPVKEPGALILLDVETESPLEIEAVFHRDFQLEWPAALGATYESWNAQLQAFTLGEETRKFAAIVGSPTAENAQAEYQTNYSQSGENSFRLGATEKGKETKIIVIAGSMTSLAEAEKTYKRLSSGYSELLRDSADYYREYLKQTVSLELPDKQMQDAYDWSRISLAQGMVTNPFLGAGLVAGYRTSGESQRPGFAWYFGRDSFWSSFALNAEGDFADTKTALEFVSKFQRDDGKMPHEISQGANFVDWFKGYPYPYASADATPLYIIAANDYVTSSGDTAFAKEKWDSLWKAYQFLKSTYDAKGLPQNFGFGHGWVEGGPLLPVKTEFYQSGLGAEALRALSNLARLAGHEDAANTLAKEFEKQRSLVNDSFWIADKKRFAFALDKNDKQVDEPTVLATVPMWFGLPSEEQAVSTIQQISDADIQTDWGMRIISNRSPLYSGGGYHYGSVWPLFTGWASVAEYRYHQEFPAYENLRANALLALDGSLGHVTEVLSGDYYQPLSTSSPHQIWSAAMVISPVLKGMMGLDVDGARHVLTFAPHVPAAWSKFSIENVRVGSSTLGLNYEKSEAGIAGEPAGILLDAGRITGSDECTIEFRPAISPRAKVLKVELNSKPIAFQIKPSATDQHVVVRFVIKGGRYQLRIWTTKDFGLSGESALPPLGGANEGLRVLSEVWSPSRDQLTLQVAGATGHLYGLRSMNTNEIQSIEGADLGGGVENPRPENIWIEIPASTTEAYLSKTVVIHFARAGPKKGR
ncbi:MAG TPA: hypothetical protein VKP61_13125 [Candidatus Acidoferrum sp.]|nr:hypothetical protein [Candidatus Acidoferrum sp.]